MKYTKIDKIETESRNSKYCKVTMSDGSTHFVNKTLNQCKKMLERKGKIVVGK